MTKTYYEKYEFIDDSEVYEPREDSFMLADYVKGIKGRVLDVGTGCGIQAVIASKTADYVLGIDINEKAVTLAKQNAEKNKCDNCEFKKSDLFENIKKDEKFDIIIFNPPYLPTENEDKIKGELNKALDGGKDGRETIDRFLKEVKNYLNKNGKIILVDSSLDNTKQTIDILENQGFKVKILENKKMFFEELSILEAVYE
ncbi:MAG: HemK2/MTQ2 family protein methyltransferase [Candidatus Micrarchaeia archaeon]|jgi:release factor glutamine methyltransferase